MIIDWSPEGWRVYLSREDKEEQKLHKLIPSDSVNLQGPVTLYKNESRGWIEVDSLDEV